MRHRVVLFKWIEAEGKEELSIVEHYADSISEAKGILSAIKETEFDLAKIFLGDALVHVQETKKKHHDQNLS